MAVISDSRKWIFVHIPKNAGLAVYHFVLPHLVHGDIAVMEGNFDRAVFDGYSIEKHAKALHFRQWMEGTGRDWASYRSFAVIRDPLTRVQSVYWEARRVGYKHRKGTWWNRMDEAWWDEFMRLPDPDAFVASGLYDRDGPLPMAHTQHSFVTGEDGRIIVKRLFLLDEMADAVPRLLGFDGHISFDHRGEYEPIILSPSSVSYIKDRYAEDYALIDMLGASGQEDDLA